MTTNADVRDEYVTLHGLRFHYRDWGDRSAPPLILLHGFAYQSLAYDTPDPAGLPPPADELLAMLGRITCPTLLVRGADSETLSRSAAERAAAAFPDAYVVDVPDAGDHVPWENPEGLFAAIRPFLFAEQPPADTRSSSSA